MIKTMAVVGVMALTFAAPSAHAQRARSSGGPIELGIDGGVTFGLDDPNITVVALPMQDFRIGYFASDKLELEPRFSINSLHGNGGSLTTYALELGLLLLPSGDRIGNGLYLRPFAGVSGVHVSNAGSTNSGYAGAGVGLKIPFADRRLATRMEANYAHGFSDGGSNQIGVTIGLSFFTR
jgi:hypothetical protein